MESKTSLANLFIAILVQTLIQVILVLVIAPEIQKYSRENILDLRLTYSGDDAYAYFKELGIQGRLWYKYYIILDFLYPFAYSTSLILLFIYLGKKAVLQEKAIKALIFAPLILFITDYAENIALIYMLSNFPEKIFFYNYAGYVTPAKHVILFANLILISFTGLAALKKQLLKP